MIRKDNVRFTDETVIKTGHPDLMLIEAEKTRCAFTIGEESGRFRVPRVLDFDLKEGRLVLERLYNLRSARQIVSSRENCDWFLERVGSALAEVHLRLQLDPEMLVPLPEKLASTEKQVFIHGDFSVDNVLFSDADNQVILLDWQMTKMHGGKATFGTAFFDLAWFVNNLFSKPVYSYIGASPVAPGATLFLRSYFGLGLKEAFPKLFVGYLKEFYLMKLAVRRASLDWRKRFLLSKGHKSWWTFIENISSI